jgi:hypothetical protein
MTTNLLAWLRLRAPQRAGLTTVAFTGTPAVAVAQARRLASLVEVTAMRHRTHHNQSGSAGRPVIRIDVTYRIPAGGRSR